MAIGKACLLVRAIVEDPGDRTGFDRWYDREHLPDARRRLEAEKAWRFWSRSDSEVHFALYQFRDLAFLSDRVNSAELSALIAEFDRVWPQVHRTREILELIQEIRVPQIPS